MHDHQANARLISLFAVFVVMTAMVIWGSLALVPKNINTGNHNSPGNQNSLGCTNEAKICPDGSAVSRAGPNCDFTDCPAMNTNVVSNTNSLSDGCKVTGCSGTVCSDHEVITDCLARPTDICYQMGECRRQTNGACEWTLTAELQSCLVQGGLPNVNK